MRINNNLMAMNTHRQLGTANADGAKSMEKLSSGYRINRAGDDAAGLAISEKMRGQIRGLNQASANAQDGISLLQTAEGALNETHAILQRMRELSVQSATDTNTDSDRKEIQEEVDQLATEITRISTDTEFNTMKLLNGDYSNKKFHIGANSDQSIDLNILDMGAKELGIEKDDFYTGVAITGLTNIEVQSDDGKAVTIKYVPKLATNENPAVSTGAKLEKDADGKSIVTITLGQEAGGSGAVGDSKFTETEVFNALKAAGVNVAVKEGQTLGTSDITTAITTDQVIASFTKVTGEDNIAKLAVGKGINVSTQVLADKAITTINDALENVSAERSKLGAMQNRLEHTIKNLDTSSENLQASEARIRDVDMAKEMMEQTKQNILAQASTAMLAQANQAPQGVLQLLR